jgi:tagatose 1,6-diphosphate aldolase
MTINLTIGKLRRLQQCTSTEGTFTCLALDHRQNLRKVNPEFADDAALSQFKLDVLTTLADLSTAVLLDPEVSAAQAIASGSLPGKSAFIVAIEATGYGGSPGARKSQVLPGWSAEKVRRMGASMVKLLVYYHPNSSAAAEIEAFVRQVAGECTNLDIGFMLEPLSYPLDAAKELSSAEKRSVVIETARRLAITGVDVLKIEFPLNNTEDPNEIHWEEACAEISAASLVPWIVLSASVDYEIYLRQVEIACRAGASGCAVGRAVWQEAVSMDNNARHIFLQTTGRERLARLTTVCSKIGKPVNDFYIADAPFDWYKTY